ncbi:UDP-GalNAc:beta-1,3-N-acetylgalactosaminyltransferase 2 [Trichonephila inaurata madagascariensis]|uniref:Hexosyltransferase n=1 Tax=Trichonephila inaurata madagascariensis TaxID=2747483 RepID=A0A8X6XYF3_9ARAC|nr:UDP-GalNAc:beta-1,3-N-acetylgalactosaminyltransferase 2 [Trichonephila inaurata madagascariensis]
MISFRTFLCILIAFVVSFYYEEFLRLHYWASSDRGHTTLAIGILSGYENFKEREAARSTWLGKYSSQNDVKAWFILGNSSCQIPPEYRLSLYSCEKWNINTSELQEKLYTAYLVKNTFCPPNLERPFYQGFSFQVNYPIVITKLGILSSLVLPDSEVKVALLDVQSKEVIVQTLISLNQSNDIYSYVYANVDTILLPKNYEGLILVEGYLKGTACSDTIWNSGGGVITFKRVYPTPEHLKSKKYSTNLNVASSIAFYIPDVENLKTIARDEERVTKKWILHLAELNNKLRMEVEEKNDIFIADGVDTYRSLPVKLLKFYKWLHLNYNFRFVVKTDDDSVLDISALLKQLAENSQFDPTKLWLWSNFRRNWPVNYVGKWSDYEYQSPVYPTFPCGAAYVMSRHVVLWLVSNAQTLHNYQGEDVSMGIWLSAINPDIIEDEDFACDARCARTSYNRAQMSQGEVFRVWSYYEKCQSLCSCD